MHRYVVALALIGIAIPWAAGQSGPGLAGLTPGLPQDSVYLEELTWTEVRDGMKAGKTTVIIPTGGTEQSGPHEVIGKENFAVHFNAGEIARRLGHAYVAPTLAYVPEGNVYPPSGHIRYPGSITLPDEAYIPVLLWAGRSLQAEGFKAIVFIGNSGGNQDGMKVAADELNRQWAGSGARAYFIGDYYTAISSGQKPLGPFDAWVRAQGEKDEDVGSHAGIKDTSTLMAVEAQYFTKGKLIRWDKLAPKGGFEGSGVSGNPVRASVAYGKVGIEMQIDRAVKQIKALMAQK
jgi:creatinine amidohydrolase/Fe(II)-dependent formamide hydrolase-like protein